MDDQGSVARPYAPRWLVPHPFSSRLFLLTVRYTGHQGEAAYRPVAKLSRAKRYRP